MFAPKILQIDLKQALKQNGCPICNTNLIAEQRYIRSILRKNGAEGQDSLIRLDCWGICQRHRWLLHEIAQHEFQDSPDNTLLYSEMLSRAIKATKSAAVQLNNNIKSSALIFRPKLSALTEAFGSSQPCQVCTVVNQSQLFHLEMLIKNLADEHFTAKYEASDQLCMPHFIAAMELPLERSLLQKLCDLQIGHLMRLQYELTACTDEINGHGQDIPGGSSAWTQTITFLAGNSRHE